MAYSGKERFPRSINIPKPGSFNAGADATGASSIIAPPVVASFGAPTNLSLTTQTERSASTPTARIAATWYPPPGVAPASYVIQWSTSNTFPDGSTNGQEAAGEASTIGGLAVSTVYYVRVAAVVANLVSAWSATASITTAADTTPPLAPTSQAASFVGAGDLVITWVNPTSPNFRAVEIGIYSDSSKTTTYATIYDATQRYVWTFAQNLAATSNAGDPSIYVELRSLGWNGLFSSAVNTGTITKSVPTTPSSLTTSWAGDAGTAGPDCVISWALGADASGYRLTIDGVARDLSNVNRYIYTLDANRAEHSGTPDPVLSISLVAIDGLKQISTAATATATNAAPAAPTVTLVAGFSIIGATVTSSAPADFDVFEFAFKLATVTQSTLLSQAALQTYQVTTDGPGSWTVAVRVRDMFGQYSSATTSSAVTLDALSIDYLRAEMVYTDDAGNSSSSLNVLKDATLGSGGITYSA